MVYGGSTSGYAGPHPIVLIELIAAVAHSVRKSRPGMSHWLDVGWGAGVRQCLHRHSIPGLLYRLVLILDIAFLSLHDTCRRPRGRGSQAGAGLSRRAVSRVCILPRRYITCTDVLLLLVGVDAARGALKKCGVRKARCFRCRRREVGDDDVPHPGAVAPYELPVPGS
jgi:hypothetical protein